MPTRTLGIFGITGQTGRAVAKAAMARGWSVRGLARPQSAASFAAHGSTIVAGDFADTDRVAETVDAADAVCCVIGPRAPYVDAFCAEATAAILVAMRRHAVRRIVCQTGAMIGAGKRTVPFAWLCALVARRQPAVMRDRVEQERLIMESGLAWTLVKPPRLTSTSAARSVQAGPNLRMGLLSSVSRASLAEFILDAIDVESSVGARLFVRA